jgi:hypothetical protein
MHYRNLDQQHHYKFIQPKSLRSHRAIKFKITCDSPTPLVVKMKINKLKKLAPQLTGNF